MFEINKNSKGTSAAAFITSSMVSNEYSKTERKYSYIFMQHSICNSIIMQFTLRFSILYISLYPSQSLNGHYLKSLVHTLYTDMHENH